MSNTYYTLVNPLLADTVAKAAEVNAELQGIELGFADVENVTNTAIKMPEDESATDFRIAASATQRVGTLLTFGPSGEPVASATFPGDMSAGGHKLRNIPTAVNGDEPVNLTQMTAYAAGLTGLPTISGQTGHLTTDGATVSWAGASGSLPLAATAQTGACLVHTGTQTKWTGVGSNSAFDPNGVLSASWWSTSLSRQSDINGPHWTNTGSLFLSTFEHLPAVSGRIPCGAGVVASLSANIAAVASAGTVDFCARYYDAGGNFLSDSAVVSVITGNTAPVNVGFTVTTPTSTAYIVPVIKFAGVTAAAYGIMVRNIKVESGAFATPFDDTKTVGLAYGGAAATYFGSGYASANVTVGDASTTAGALHLRSAAGVQTYDVRILSTGGVNGTAGKGVMTMNAQRIECAGIFGASSEYDCGNSGAAKTISFGTNGQYQRITLNAATPALTLDTTQLAVGRYFLKVIQDGVGGRAPTWIGLNQTQCVANIWPTLSTGASGVTFISFYWDGSLFWASSNPWD